MYSHIFLILSIPLIQNFRYRNYLCNMNATVRTAGKSNVTFNRKLKIYKKI